MASEEQTQANQENAQLSTGPKTEEGKAISSLNSLKHGLLSKEVLLDGEDETVLIDLGKRLRTELKPIGELEVILVERVISNIWRLRRSLEAERALMEYQKFFQSRGADIDFSFGEVKIDENIERQQEKRAKIKNMISNEEIEKIIRYENSIERGMFRALHELQRIQSARLGQSPPLPIALDVIIDKDSEEGI